MTLEELIEHGEFDLDVFGGTHREFIEAALEAFHDQDRFKWHCTRDYPGDVPGRFEKVLAIRDSGLPYIAIWNGKAFKSLNGRGFYKVNWWRYIDYPKGAKDELRY